MFVAEWVFSVVVESGDCSLVAVTSLWSMDSRVCRLQVLWRMDPAVLAPGLSCSELHGIFLGQGLKLCLLLWQVEFPCQAPREAPLFLSLRPSPGLLECPYDIVASLPQNKTEKETVRWKLCVCVLFYDLILEITRHHHILFTRTRYLNLDTI